MVYTDRYALSGHVLPLLKDWMCETIGIDINLRAPAQVQTQFLPTQMWCQRIFSIMICLFSSRLRLNPQMSNILAILINCKLINYKLCII